LPSNWDLWSGIQDPVILATNPDSEQLAAKIMVESTPVQPDRG
jgi:hypothetical protein